MASVVTTATTSSSLVTKTVLYLECMHLPNLDVASKTDAMVEVYLSDARGSDRCIGKTEVVKDSLNPKFSTSISLDYFFEETQRLSFQIWDVDDHSRDFIGTMNCAVGDIFGAKGSVYCQKIGLHHPTILGKSPVMIVRGEEVKGANQTVKIQFSGHNLDKKDPGPFAKSDPFLNVYKLNQDRSKVLVHRTETVLKTLNPTWQPFYIHISKLCNGDLKNPIFIECFDWDKHSSDDLIGVCQTTLEDMLKPGFSAPLINVDKAKKKSSYKDSGKLSIMQISIETNYSFLDYLGGGVQLNMMVAIDYTGSNGNPATASSLHYRDPSGALNQYATAIMNVGNILMPYDYDGRVPVYGFGAKLANGQVSFCFPVNGDPHQPEVVGIKGILDVYYNSFNHLSLYGPTNFAPVIQAAASVAQTFHAMKDDVSTYLLLLILTDGEITDMADTVDAIVNASQLPMSIIIVGIGNDGFSNMNKLDSDDRLLTGRTGKAKRDIVQFVPLRNCPTPLALGQQTLAELPNQVVEYMRLNGIKPKPRTQVNVTQIVQAVESVQIAAPSVPQAVIQQQQQVPVLAQPGAPVAYQQQPPPGY